MMRRAQALVPYTCIALALLLAAAPIKGKHRAALSRDLAEHLASGSSRPVRVIVHGDPDTIDTLVTRHGLAIKRLLDGGAVLEAGSAELESLSQDPEIDHLSGDVLVRSGMLVSNQATGADQVWGGFDSLAGVTGKGIGIAVIDSGIAAHVALEEPVVNVSFVAGSASAHDEYGHGTHVAGIIAGQSGPAEKVTPLYTGGIAPGAHLLNLRVLGPDGAGLTSDVIAAVDWAIANRHKHAIRVINLSLGHPVMEPSATDPLCEAVARAVHAGIVVVASAGNLGRDEDGTPVLGGIVSPGNSPYAITVGALNTWGTPDRSDDTVTTYSSRGPTRFDLRMKPDLVAPGNKIVSLEAGGSSLATRYPSEHIAGSSSTNSYFRMSGTSMAAPMVSGAAALLLEANPRLDTWHVKLALQMSASYMVEAGLVGGGAGSLNLPSARQIASAGPSDPVPGAVIAGASVHPGGVAYWDPGTLADRLYSGVGMLVISRGEIPAVWAAGKRVIWGNLSLFGLANPVASLAPGRIIWGNATQGSASPRVIWGDAVVDAAGRRVIWGDSLEMLTLSPNRVIWGSASEGTQDPQ